MEELETHLPSDGDDDDTFGDIHGTFWDDHNAIDDEVLEDTADNHSQLLKTLVPSPVIKDIFEANTRSPNAQDIIFIKVFINSCLMALMIRILQSSCIVRLTRRSSWNRRCLLEVRFAQQYHTHVLEHGTRVLQMISSRE